MNSCWWHELSARRPARRRLIRGLTVLTTCFLLLAPWVPAGPIARADDGQYETFYTPPSPLPPGAPGDLIRTEPQRLVLEPSGQLGAFTGSGTRIMYRSNDAQGNPVAVTGTYIEPDQPWPGKGPRPLIAYATGPYGMGEQCAPSRLFDQGIHFSQGLDLMLNFEEGFIATLLARGYAVVVTDGVGMGIHTTDSPQFLNRVAAGSALIDAARAAMKLPGTSLNPHGPVAFWGWITGGQASLSAAELAGAYAPELNVAGTYAAAPVTDVAAALPTADGNFLAGFDGWVLRGLFASYPELEQPIRDALTPRGIQMLDWSGRTCTLQMAADFAFRHTRFWFNDDPKQMIATDPLKTILASQRLGTIKPTGPVYITHNRWDPLSPYQSSVDTANAWCAKGADVQLWTNEEPPLFNALDVNDLLPQYVDGERSMAWLTDRFNGVPTTPNCGQF